MNATIKIRKPFLMTWLALFSFVVLQKISIPIGGEQFSICLFVYIFFVLQMVLKGKAKISKKRSLLFLFFIAVSFITCLMNPQFSIFSFLLFILIYSFYLIEFDYSDAAKQKIGEGFEKILLVAAVLGIVQFLVDATFGFYIEPTNYLPESWCLDGFNTFYPLWYKAGMNKSNGFFFLEPSFFSQFMAIGIIYEMMSRKRMCIIALFTVGLAVSFSGTGILLLVLFVIPILNKLNTKQKILFILAGIAFITVYLNSPYSASITSRFFEIKHVGSSAAGRFSNPLPYIFLRPFGEVLIGSGPGSCTILKEMTIRADMNALYKVMYEYGIVNTVVFLSFITSAFCRKGKNIFAFAVMIFYLFLSGSLLQPVIALFSYFIVDFVPTNDVLVRDSNRQKFRLALKVRVN